MKRLFFYSTLIVSLYSCETKESSGSSTSNNILENLSYSVDTLVVDPGEELINLSMGLYFSDISKDKKWLYHFDLDNTLINAIDLDKLILDHRIKFEKEGPDGIGSYISSIQALADENFLISTFQSSGIFDNQGKKIEDATIDPSEITSIGEDDEVELAFQLTSSDDRTYLFSLPGDYMASGRDLVVLDKAKQTGKSFDIPKLDLTGNYSIIQKSGEMAEISMEEYFLEEIENKLYIASSVTSDVYRYELTTDSLTFYSLPLQVAPKTKTELPKREVSSREEYMDQRALVQSQISYSSLLWDDTRDLFFRIGSTVKSSETPEGKPTFSVYMIAFDPAMNLVGETKLENFKRVPSYPFFKDGKLYSYVNVEDELGFAVFTFDF